MIIENQVKRFFEKKKKKKIGADDAKKTKSLPEMHFNKRFYILQNQI